MSQYYIMIETKLMNFMTFDDLMMIVLIVCFIIIVVKVLQGKKIP